MKDTNRVFLIGRLTRDIEIRYTASGTAVTEFSIAVNESIKKGDTWEDYVNFFNVTVWGNTAINCEKFLKKGSQCAVDGRLHQDRWENDGVKHNTIKIQAESVQFIGKSNASTEDNSKPETEDIPF